jgi:hypothetical protein
MIVTSVLTSPHDPIVRRFFFLLCPLLLEIATLFLVLAYPMGCWPGLMRATRLTELYGIDARDLTSAGMKRWSTNSGYWTAYWRGAAFGFALATVGVGIGWATSSTGFPTGFVALGGAVVIASGGLSGKAWVVRQLVAERVVASVEKAPKRIQPSVLSSCEHDFVDQDEMSNNDPRHLRCSKCGEDRVG